MTLDDLFSDLAFGELNGTGMVGIDGGVIPLAKYPQIISYVNTGLTQLHTIFLIKENYVTCRELLGQTEYLLHSKHGDAVGINGETKHIVDTVGNPFLDDILSIEYLTDELGDLITLNDDTITYPYWTSGHKTITVDTVYIERVFHVIYRANHAKIPLATTDLTAVEIDIPANFLLALQLFVASKGFASINSDDARKRSMGLYQEFLAQVKLLKELNQGTIGYASDHYNDTTRGKGWA